MHPETKEIRKNNEKDSRIAACLNQKECEIILVNSYPIKNTTQNALYLSRDPKNKEKLIYFINGQCFNFDEQELKNKEVILSLFEKDKLINDGINIFDRITPKEKRACYNLLEITFRRGHTQFIPFEVGLSCVFKNGVFDFLNRSTMNFSLFDLSDNASYAFFYNGKPGDQEYDAKHNQFTGKKYTLEFHLRRLAPAIILNVVIKEMTRRINLLKGTLLPTWGGYNPFICNLNYIDLWNNNIRYHKDTFAEYLLHTIYITAGLNPEEIPNRFWTKLKDEMIISDILNLAKSFGIILNLNKTPENSLAYFQNNNRYKRVLKLTNDQDAKDLNIKADTLAVKEVEKGYTLTLFWKAKNQIQSITAPCKNGYNKILSLLPEPGEYSDSKTLIDCLIPYYRKVLDHYVTPLMFIARKGPLSAVKELVENGADISLTDENDHDVLWYAKDSAIREYIKTIQALHTAIITTNRDEIISHLRSGVIDITKSCFA
ncbi:MAG: hypothetical protein JO131_02780, partial [Gammaproteobacteria bacterium]|nr:hypothetical protein [Gammaproteobacteria bacterium]